MVTHSRSTTKKEGECVNNRKQRTFHIEWFVKITFHYNQTRNTHLEGHLVESTTLNKVLFKNFSHFRYFLNMKSEWRNLDRIRGT